jgi:hypothetical protein
MSGPSDMLAVSRTAQRLASGYYAFLVAQLVAANPQSINSLPPAKGLGKDPIGEITRKDGTAHTLNLRYYLDLFREDHGLQREVLRAWAMGALLTLGDELSPHHYFDRAPVLELVYHLRNGVAHGNRFNITNKGRDRLARYPAHNRSATVKSPAGVVYEITPSPSGPLLFDFMGPADVIDLLQSVEIYLSKIAGARPSSPRFLDRSREMQIRLPCGRSKAEKGSCSKRSVPVRLGEVRAPLLLQWPRLAQAPRRSRAESPAASVEG